MTLTELRYIVAVATEKHFGRAAETCYVSQPTLSMAVKKLEESLGVAVFERAKSEVFVTTIGEQIVRQAQKVLEEADKIKQIAECGQDPLREAVRIGVIYTIGPYLLPQLLPNINQLVPQMPVILHENYTAVLSEKLLRGELDVLIISLPFHEPGTQVRSLYEEPFVVVVPSSHPWNKQEEIHAPNLADEQLLLLGEGHCFRQQVLELCPKCRDVIYQHGGIQQSIEGSSLETIRHMVLTGLAVTVLPVTAAGVDKYSQRLLSIKRFAEPVPSRHVALAWRSSFTRTEVIDIIQRAVVECDLSGVKYC